MRTIRPIIVIFVMLMHYTPLAVMAKPESMVLLLPDGHAFQPYRVVLQEVLGDRKLKLDSDSPSPAFRWSIDAGALPEGLILVEDGTIWGTPQRPTEGPVNFSLRVSDISIPAADSLTVQFSIQVKRTGVRLTTASPAQLSDSGPTTGAQPEQRGVAGRSRVVFSSTGAQAPGKGDSAEGASKKSETVAAKSGPIVPPATSVEPGEYPAQAAWIDAIEPKLTVKMDARTGLLKCFDRSGKEGSCMKYNKWDRVQVV